MKILEMQNFDYGVQNAQTLRPSFLIKSHCYADIIKVYYYITFKALM